MHSAVSYYLTVCGAQLQDIFANLLSETSALNLPPKDNLKCYDCDLL